MNRTEAKRDVHWASGINVIVGIWLILAPWWLGYSTIERAVVNDMVIGAAVFILALARVGAPLRYESLSWVNVVFGLWLIVAPWVLAYGEADVLSFNESWANWNDVVCGVIIAVLGALSAWAAHKAPELRHADHAAVRDSYDRRYDVGREEAYGDARRDGAYGAPRAAAHPTTATPSPVYPGAVSGDPAYPGAADPVSPRPASLRETTPDYRR